jgi:hypothetical protein
MFILQRWGDGPNEVEQAVAARRDMRAVLKVVGRPIALSRCVVTFVKQHIKSVKNEGFVFFFNRLTHGHSPSSRALFEALLTFIFVRPALLQSTWRIVIIYSWNGIPGSVTWLRFVF